MARKPKRRYDGEGTMFKRKNSRKWQAAIPVPLPTGGTKRTYFYGTQQECREWLNKMRYDIQLGKPVLDSNITLIAWLRIWLARYCVNIRDTTRMNYISYQNHIARHRIAQISLKALSTDELQEFISFLKKSGKLSGEGGLSNKTIRNLFQMLKTALKQAQGNQLIWSNPAEYCQLPKVEPKEKHFLTADELNRLLKAAEGERWYIALILLSLSGIRLGEALSVRHDSLKCEGDIWILEIQHSVKRVKNFNAKENEPKTILQVSETKTASSRRQIPLLPEVVSLLQEHIRMQQEEAANSYGLYAENPFIVSNILGSVTDPSNFRRWYKQMLKKAEISTNYRIHDLRGTWASASLKAGIPLQYVSILLGHSSQSVTEKYYLSYDNESKQHALQPLESVAKALLEHK